MYVYQRSSSTSQAPGATLAYTFTGSGLDIIGPNSGSARLNVRLDGKLIATNVPTTASTNFQQTFSVPDLPWGRHTVTVEVVAGTLVVDAVGVFATCPAATDHEGVAPLAHVCGWAGDRWLRRA
jgi:hypothetical protein